MLDGIDLLHACAWQREIEGTLRAIYEGGLRVGYSDKLTMELLKAHRPGEFRPQSGRGIQVAISGDAQVMVASTEQVIDKVREITPLIRTAAWSRRRNWSAEAASST